jgi:long-chain acyl-CoA synthetase
VSAITTNTRTAAPAGVPELTSVADILTRAAARDPDKTALVCGSRSLTYGELDELSGRLARALAARGVGSGDRVSILAQNRWEWVVAYHGVLKAGAVVNPLNVMLTDEEVAYIAGDCSTRVVFTSSQRVAGMLELAQDLPTLDHVVSFDDPPAGALGFQQLLDEDGQDVPPLQVDPSTLCTIAYTSGTTGRPKGAMQSHQAVLLNCALTATMHVRTAADTVVTALPAPHVYGNVVINSTFLAGGTVVLMERFDPAEALGLIDLHRATLFEGVPAMYGVMLASPEIASVDLSSLTRSTVGGQTIALSVVREWEQRTGAPLIELWGMTELAGLGTTHALYAPRVPGSIGVSLPGIELRVADLENSSQTAPPHVAGELLVRGPLLTLGYYGNDKATAELIDVDGWLHTGDVAYADEQGHHFVVDRLKDLIITGGYNVYPAEIERVAAAHPAVALVAVGPMKDPVKGELARAYVVLRPGSQLSEQELIDFCRPHLAAYKLPRSVRFVDDLPKTSTGKIMRRALGTLDAEWPA